MTGAELRARRKAMKLSQEELAQLLSVQRNTVARWENDRHTIPHYLPLALETLERTAHTPSPST